MIKTKDILRLTFTLLLITSLVAAALAGVNAITGPIINQLRARKIQDSVSAVLPGGGEKLESFPDQNGLIQAFFPGKAVQCLAVNTTDLGHTWPPNSSMKRSTRALWSAAVSSRPTTLPAMAMARPEISFLASLMAFFFS